MADFKQMFRDKLFLIGLILKLLIAGFFVGGLFLKGFLPFIDYFVQSGFANPYDHFHTLQNNTIFPYSSVMLWITSLPYILVAGIKVLWIKVLAIKGALLIADMTILRVLFKWFPVYKRKILIYYRLSPILIFISYFYGQFDVIPTAILFVSLYLLTNNKYALSMLFLGIGIATKTHLLLVVPFIFFYLRNKKLARGKIFSYMAIVGGTTIALLLPYLFSLGYESLVLHNTEQIKIFSLFLNYGFNDLKLFLIPGLYLILILLFRFEKRMTQDYLMAFLGIIFGLLVVLVPPALGWFYRSLPFILYFYIKYKDIPKTSLLILYVAYFLFFIFEKNSDVMSVFSFINPKLSTVSLNGLLFNPYTGDVVQNVLFTILIIATVMTVMETYKSGFFNHKKYENKQLLIGIGGDSGSGKSTFVSSIMGLFKKDLITLVEGDDVHKRPRGHKNWETLTHLNPKSNNLHLDLIHAKMLKSGDHIYRKHYDHSTGQFTEPKDISSSKYLIFTGLHPFFLESMRDAMDIKIFIKPEETLRLHRKTMRDMSERGYTKEKVVEQLQKREDDSKKYIQSQEKFSDIIIKLSPLQEIKNIGDASEKVDLKLSIEASNSYYIEQLLERLSDVSTLTIEHYLNEQKQVCEFSGTILSQELKSVVVDVIPNYYLITQKDVEFQPDIQGIMQLFILYIKHKKLTEEI